MKKYLILLLSIFSITKVFPNDKTKNFSVGTIPGKLRKNAHAVIRYSKTEMKVLGLDKVMYKRKYAITILDEKGENYSSLTEGYNLMLKIDRIKGRLFDSSGTEIRSLKEKDIADYSTYGTSFVYHSDSRIKSYDFNYSRYPYTVEYEIDKIIKTTFFIPDWETQPNYDCAVEHTEFSLSFRSSIPVRYKEYLMPENVEKSSSKDEDGNDILSWKLENINAYNEQPYSRTENHTAPTVVLAPGQFELLKYKGDMLSWNNIGLFIYKLNEGRDILPDDKKAIVKNLVQGEPDIYSKVQKLYAYMQQSTRYVANEYGIAGWQTFDAVNVAKNGYGDCKGLTNYLKALLKEAGINSYVTLVYAGEEDYYKIDEDFPANTFNHVILCVPQPDDSIWIECTSQQLPAGYLGSFTQGRKVLLTSEDGGVLCVTPSYDKNKSFIIRNSFIQLDKSSRQQKIKIETHYSGLMQDDIEYMLKTQPENKIKEMVNTKFPFPSYNVSAYNYKYSGSHALPAIEEEAELMVSGIISSTQKRTFVNVGWMNNPMNEIFQTETRSVPFVLHKSFRIVDSVLVDLPPGMEIESLPEAVSLKYTFGTYQIQFTKRDDQLSLIRIYEQNQGVYNIAEFENYQKMYRVINSGKNNLSVVLLNKAS